jgi:histidine ammonia-lyase
MAEVVIGRDTLTLDVFDAVVTGRAKVKLAPEVKGKMDHAVAILRRHLSSGHRVYGVNTQYGSGSATQVPPERIKQMQVNTVLSHSSGVGPPVPEDLVRGMLLVRANVLSKGYSGAPYEIVERLVVFLNENVIPYVPIQGSLGASGDLIPGGHLGLALLGEGKVFFRGGLTNASLANDALGLRPLDLGEKGGLSMVNGTPFMTSYGARSVLRTANILRCADVVGAATLQVLRGLPSQFDERLIDTRPHAGSHAVAANLRGLSVGSELLDIRPTLQVHDPYSLRCMPQVHGASRDAWSYAKRTMEVELDSVTDNPLFFDDGTCLSGGNFHGQPVALALDVLCMALSELASLSHRRIALLLTSWNNPQLPSKLACDPTESTGLFMLGTAAASLVSENKSLSTPASVDSIPVDAVEDHVSMGALAARKADATATNVEAVLGIELLCAAQALDLLRPSRASAAIEAVHDAVRVHVPFAKRDRPLVEDIAAAQSLIASKRIVEVAEERLGSPLL